MKCPNCFNEIDRNLSECPYCGNVNLATMKLPVLKKDAEQKQDEKDAINEKINEDLVSFLEDKGLDKNYDEEVNDFKDETIPIEANDSENPFKEKINESFDNVGISSQIDDYSFDDNRDDESNISSEKVDSEESSVIESNESNLPELDEEAAKKEAEILKEAAEEQEFEKKLPMRKRVISTALIAIALLFIAFLIYFMVTGKGDDYSKFSLSEVEVSLNEYYKESNDSKLEKVLSTIDNEEQLSQAQEKTKEIVTGWINENLDREFTTETDLNTTVDKYRTLLNGIYNYQGKDNSYSLLSKEDYMDLLNIIENTKNGNGTYFKAEKLYNEKAYNEAYKELSKISSTNKSFEDAKALKKKIIAEILAMLKAEIDKISGVASNDEIKELFTTYCDLYNNVPLNTDSEYQALYSQYK